MKIIYKSFYSKYDLGEDTDNNVETFADSIAANEVVDFDESAKQTDGRDNNMNVSFNISSNNISKHLK